MRGVVVLKEFYNGRKRGREGDRGWILLPEGE